MNSIDAGGSATQIARDIAVKHAGAEVAALIEKDTLKYSIVRVLARIGSLNGEGNLQWDKRTPDEPDVSVVDSAVCVDFGDAQVRLTVEAAESLVSSLVSAIEVSRAQAALSSGPVADLLNDFMEKFGKPK